MSGFLPPSRSLLVRFAEGRAQVIEPADAGDAACGRASYGYGIADGRVMEPVGLVHVAPPDGTPPPPLSYPPMGLVTQLAWQPGRMEILADPVGAYPLYAAHAGGQVLFVGSDAWQVAAAAGLSEIDDEACMDLLAFEFVIGSRTLVRGLEELPAGRRIVFTWDGAMPRRSESTEWEYAGGDEWDLPREALLDRAYSNLAELCEPIAALVRQGSHRLALNLSGGWDSRALLGCLAPLGPERLFTCTYGSSRFSGMKAARAASQAAGIANRLFPFDDAQFLRTNFADLCALLPPVVRFNLGDGALAVSRSFYGVGDVLAVCGHSGDAWTSSPCPREVADGDACGLGHWVNRRWRGSFTRDALARFLSAGNRGLADAAEEHALDSARAAWLPGRHGAVRWRIEQRGRRLINVELRVLQARAGVVFLPMMDRSFIEFWSHVPSGELEDQRLYRDMLARRVFAGAYAALGRIPREGGGQLLPGGRIGKAALRAKRYGLALSRRVAPALASSLTSADPTVAWWRGDPELRGWARTVLSESRAAARLFDPAALDRLLQEESLRDYQLAQTGVWSLLTIAGVEKTLDNLRGHGGAR